MIQARGQCSLDLSIVVVLWDSLRVYGIGMMKAPNNNTLGGSSIPQSHRVSANTDGLPPRPPPSCHAMPHRPSVTVPSPANNVITYKKHGPPVTGTTPSHCRPRRRFGGDQSSSRSSAACKRHAHTTHQCHLPRPFSSSRVSSLLSASSTSK